MDRLKNTKSSTPDLTRVDKLDVIKLRRDGQYRLTSDINGKLNPNLNLHSMKVNQRMEAKSIVNNKPSQFGPILGVNFHNVKR